VRGYLGTHPYEKALRKRKVWIEPLFGEAKDWHGLRRFRLRRLEKVNIEALLVAAGQRTRSDCLPSEATDRRSWPRRRPSCASPNRGTSPDSAPLAASADPTDGGPSGGRLRSEPRVFQQAGSFVRQPPLPLGTHASPSFFIELKSQRPLT
jgi:hypothetical protein